MSQLRNSDLFFFRVWQNIRSEPTGLRIYLHFHQDHRRPAAGMSCLYHWQESHIRRITHSYDSRWSTNALHDVKIGLRIPCFVSSLSPRNLESQWHSLRDSKNPPEAPHIIASWAASSPSLPLEIVLLFYTAKVCLCLELFFGKMKMVK